MAATRTLAEVTVGQELPPLELTTGRTFIVAAALASRDFEPVHHDPDAARRAGLEDVFLNILTTNGLVVRLVTDWAGPAAVVRASRIRLGVPHVAGDTLRLTGTVQRVEPDGTVEVAVVGRNSRGDHVTGTVVVSLPADGGGDR